MSAPVSLAEIKRLREICSDLKPGGVNREGLLDGRLGDDTGTVVVLRTGHYVSEAFDRKLAASFAAGWNALPALIELAEAYLAVRDFDKRPKGMGFGGAERQFAQERLNMAANQVRP